jgi:hypothetical protein
VWSLAWGHDSRQLASLNWPSFRMCTQSIWKFMFMIWNKVKCHRLLMIKIFLGKWAW